MSKMKNLLNAISKYLIVLVVCFAIFTSASSVFLYTEVHNQQAVAVHAAESLLASHCSFFRDLGTLPVLPTTSSSGSQVPPSKLGVKLVADSRTAYAGIGCRPVLPPSPTLNHWAAVYNITVNG